MTSKKVRKTQAGKDFVVLIEALKSSGAIEIINDDGSVAAVLLSKREYDRLCSFAPRRSPRGLIVGLDDEALQDASKMVREDFEDSITKSLNELF